MIVKANQSEIEDLLNRPLNADADRRAALAALHARGAAWAILTLGVEGALLGARSMPGGLPAHGCLPSTRSARGTR